jgi:hypothetical protein
MLESESFACDEARRQGIELLYWPDIYLVLRGPFPNPTQILCRRGQQKETPHRLAPSEIDIPANDLT